MSSFIPTAVQVVINHWRQVGAVLVPDQVTAIDNPGECIFHFYTITVNTVDEAIFTLPVTTEQ